MKITPKQNMQSSRTIFDNINTLLSFYNELQIFQRKQIA